MEHTQLKQERLQEVHVPSEVEWERVSRRFIPRLFLRRLFWTVFALVLVFGVILPIILTVGKAYFTITVWVFGALCFLLLASVSCITALDYRFRGFVVRESDLLIKEGVIFRFEYAIPFSRIQHIRLDGGFIDRLFDLRTLHFCTAGGQSKRINGCSRTMANTIRQFAMKQVVQVLATQFNPSEEVENQ